MLDLPADLSEIYLQATRRLLGGSLTEPWVDVPEVVVATASAAKNPLVLAGPALWDEGGVAGVAGLHALAAAADVRVLNTWGLKGVFDWRSRHHLATGGLQQRDLRLGGLSQADLVLTVGLDPAELPESPAAAAGDGGAALVEVEVAALAPLAERWRRSAQDVPLPSLRPRLAEVTEQGWRQAAPPLAPSAVTRAYGQLVGASGAVAADPGLAGYWVARTYPTTRLGEVAVPASSEAHGFALAYAVAARRSRPSAPALAVADAPLRPEHEAWLDVARRARLPLVLELWDPEGPALDAPEHAERLRAALRAPEPTVLQLATDGRALTAMVEVAGPVTAWGGLR